SFEDARVMAGGKQLTPEPARVIERHAEFDFAIAQHVGIRGAPGLVLAQEVFEHPRAILCGEADTVQRYAELSGDRAGVLEILSRRAVAIVVLVPVAHEEPLHIPALFLQEQGGDGGIDPAGEANDDAGGGHGRNSTRDGPKRRRRSTRATRARGGPGTATQGAGDTGAASSEPVGLRSTGR